MPRILICSTPRVGSVSYTEQLSKLLCLPIAFQPWEPYAFNKQSTHVQEITLKYVNTKNVLIHSHIHACKELLNTMDHVIFIGRKNRIQQAWSFFVAHHIGKMQNIDINNMIIPRPPNSLVHLFCSWIKLWDEKSKNKHVVFYEDLNLQNDIWKKCNYENIKIDGFNEVENEIKKLLNQV